MKNNDIIKSFEKSLYVQFSSTGELRNISTLRLDQGVTFSYLGNRIEARYHNNASESFLVERFSSETLAHTAFQNLQATVKCYMRYRRLAWFWKAVIKWAIAPLMLAILALAINIGATRAVVENRMSQLSISDAAPIMPQPANLTAVQQLTPRSIVARPSELARAMADGAKSGKYTVKLSHGSKGTLYIFSDPSCLHCQDLERELNKLAKDYTIYIFPVTVIGAEASSHQAVKLLCAKPDARATLWKKMIAGGNLQGQECANGADAVARNDQFFRVMRFVGTPAIINVAGEQTPDSIPNTAEAIKQWMSGSASTQK